MKTIITIMAFLVGAVIVSTFTTAVPCSQDYEPATIGEILANPEAYDGKKVEIYGVATAMWDCSIFYCSGFTLSDGEESIPVCWASGLISGGFTAGTPIYVGRGVIVYGTVNLIEGVHIVADDVY